MTDRKDLVPAAGEFLVFAADDGTAQVHVRIADGTVWLTQKQIAVLYGKDVRTINEHLGNVYDEGELDPAATIRKFRVVQTARNRKGSRQIARVVEHYSLPAIIAVGYRVPGRAGHEVPAMGDRPALRVSGEGLRHGGSAGSAPRNAASTRSFRCLRPVQRRLRSAGGRHCRELHAIHAESWRGRSARSGGGWQAPAPRTIEFGTGPRCRIRGG